MLAYQRCCSPIGASMSRLWAAEQLPRTECVSPGGPAHLVPLSPAAQSEGPAPYLGPLQGDTRALSSTTASDHSPLGGSHCMTRVTQEEPGAGKPQDQSVTLASVLDRSAYALLFSSRDKTSNTGPSQIVGIGPDRDLKKTQP
jgi:hypothetical protein